MKLKNKANKVQFNTAHELLNNPHLNPKTSKDINIKNAISFYQNKSRVQNTEKATKNWLEAFEKFRKDMNESYPQDEQYMIQLHLISDMSILENQVAGFIATMKKRDGTEYKALSRGVMGGIAQRIPIPADPPNSGGPCYDYKLYFEERPVDAESDFYLQANPRWQETGIWYRKQHIG
ncbi:unnamed protein product [Rhizophagus irregularis]|nr:unnamed protein product [Rhizophagus irregularis]